MLTLQGICKSAWIVVQQTLRTQSFTCVDGISATGRQQTLMASIGVARARVNHMPAQ